MNEIVQSSTAAWPAGLATPELLHSLADGVYITDLNRRILFWNRAAERITGWPAVEVTGKSCYDDILAHVDKDGHALCGQEYCPLHRSIVTGQASTESVLVFARHRSGGRIPVEVSVAPIRNAANQVIGGIEVFRDLTESMQDQLRAKGIQEMAMNCPLPEDSRVEFEVRYQPREIVGGDFYRIERTGADGYVLLVADAMGHGVAAALYTMQLRALWDDHRTDLESPARFLGVVNERLHALAREAGYFATGVCAAYDAARGQLRCARAGHPAPLLFRAGGSIEPVGRSQPALGMFPGSQYQETTVQLMPGDALLLFTDGALELFDASDHELGVEGLKELVRQQTSGRAAAGFQLDKLEEQLLRFTNQIHLPDDLTLVKLRRQR
jgi:sigma-B regulation protein RsbU (phosphoserine phosphatase)